MSSWKYTVDKITDNATITGISPKPTNKLEIPDKIDGHKVVGIADRVFEKCTELTSVVIGNNVQNVGEYVFSKCNNLKNVTIPNSMLKIGLRMFEDCNALTNISINSNAAITNIDNYAFINCSNLASITIPTNTNRIGPYAFYNTGLESITFPDNLTGIGSYAFYNCPRLTSVTIGKKLNYAGYYAFDKCSSITQVKIYPDDAGLSAWANINFDNIEANPLYTTEEKRTLKYGTSEIAGNIEIKGSCERIGRGVFFNCDKITNIKIPNSVINVYQYAFENCADTLFDTETVPGVKLVDGWAVGYINDDIAEDLDLTIFNQEENHKYVRNIAGSAFENCKKIKSVKIPTGTSPKTLTRINRNAFNKCTNISAVYISDLAKWCQIYFGNRESNPLYTANLSSIQVLDENTSEYIDVSITDHFDVPISTDYIGTCVFNSLPLTSIAISSDIRFIEWYAFSDCPNLENVTFLDNDDDSSNNRLTSIMGGAFQNCGNLTSINLPDSLTGIGDGAFYNCSSLISVHIPVNSNLTAIGTNVFNSCKSFATIDIPDNIKIIGDASFANCNKLISVDVPNTVTKILTYSFSNCSRLLTANIGNNVESIGDAAFKECTNLLSICIPDTTKTIGLSTFYNCINVNDVKLGNGLQTIKNSAFENCRNFEQLSIPESTTYIGEKTFANCKSIVSVDIPNSVTNLGKEAFLGCTALSNALIKANIKSIEDGVFNKTGLISVDIPHNITTIGLSSFGYCDKLTSVNIPATLTNAKTNAFISCNALEKVNINDFIKWCEIDFDNAHANPLFYSKKLYLDGNEVNLSDNFEIPNGVKKIGNYVFYDCDDLTSIIVPNTVRSIGSHSFDNCDSITNVTTGNNTTVIGEYAFENCENLNLIILGTIIEDIKEGAFYNCNNLAEIRMNANFITNNYICFYPEDEGYTIKKSEINLRDEIKNRIVSDIFALGCDGKNIFMSFPVSYDRNTELSTYLTYSGANTDSKETIDSNVDEIKESQYGATDYENYTYDLTKENSLGEEIRLSSSADRFDCALAFIEQVIPIDGTTEKEAENPTYKIYDLNSDASYIALYPGIMGLTRLWAVNLYRDSKEPKPIELLGYTHDTLSSAVKEYEDLLKEDEDGTLTNVDTDIVISAIYRVYENYISGDYIQIHTNDALYDNKSEDHELSLKWSVELSSPGSFGIKLDNISGYNALLYNRARGSVFPIYAGPLNKLSTGLTYISSQTREDEYFLANHSLTAGVELTGTPNIFGLQVDGQAVPANETNSFFNISSMNAAFRGSGNETLSVDFTFWRIKNDADYLLDKNSIFFAIYKNSVEEYERYHYFLHHPDEWPYNGCYKCYFDRNDQESNKVAVIKNYDISNMNAYVGQTVKARFGNTNYEYMICSLTATENKIELNNNLAESTGILSIIRTDAGWPPEYVPEDSIGLSMSQISSLNDIPHISSGSLAFKTNEESEIYDGYRYPPTIAESELYKVFATANKNMNQLYNVFDLSNTYIFEIEKPKDMANRLSGPIQVPVYGSINEQRFVTHESLCAVRIANGNISSMSAYISGVSYRNYDNDLTNNVKISALGIPAEIPPAQEGYTPYEITEKDLKDYLKIYASWTKEEGGIALYFNYNNLFNSPFVYRRSTGYFSTCYIPETYLKLKAGESGLLTIMTQLRYIDGYGHIRGAKNLPVLAYKIWNVSDDKPKFVAKNRWIIDDATLETVRGKEVGEGYGDWYLNIDSKELDTKTRLNSDFTTKSSYEIETTANFTYGENRMPGTSMIEMLTFDLIYDFSDEYIEFVDAPNAIFSNQNGRIHITADTASVILKFRLLINAPIAENQDVPDKKIWLDAINPVITLKNGGKISGEYIRTETTDDNKEEKNGVEIEPGLLRFVFRNPVIVDKLLSKEHKKNNFTGYIFTDDDNAVKVYGHIDGEEELEHDAENS